MTLHIIHAISSTYRPHTTSAVCLTLMAGFSFAIVTSFGLPALGVGTHFYYSTFLKICWLSVSVEDYAVQEFAYFVIKSFSQIV